MPYLNEEPEGAPATTPEDSQPEIKLVGSGICYCGSDMAGHGSWDNHSPTEMMYEVKD